MRHHLSSNKNSSLQKLYKNKIPIYRLNRPKFSIKDVNNFTQRFTYNEKLHMFTEQDNKTSQEVYDYKLNDTFSKIKLKKKQTVKMAFTNNFPSQNSEKQNINICQSKMRFSTRPKKKLKLKQMCLMTEFDTSFLKNYCKQNQIIKANQKSQQKNFKQFWIQPKVKNSNLKRRQDSKVQKNQLSTIKGNSSKLINQMKQINLLNMKNDMNQQQIENNAKIDKQIEIFFEFVEALLKLQYNQTKIDEWVSHYVLTNKRILKDIFLKEKGYNRASSTDIQYGIQSKEDVKLKAKKFKRIINFKEIGIQLDDLKDLNIFIEDILIQKQFFQLKRLEDFIYDKTKSIQNNYEDLKNQKSVQLKKIIEKYSTKKRINLIQHYQTYNFYDDVKIMQDLYGPIKGVTRSNRRIFQDLTLIQVNTHKKQMI